MFYYDDNVAVNYLLSSHIYSTFRRYKIEYNIN